MALRARIPRKMGVTFLFIISYVIMLLLPLLLGMLIYATSISVIEEEISQSNETMLNQLRQDIDRRLLDVREMAQKIELDTRVTSLAYRKLPLEIAQRYTMFQIVQDFRAYLVPDRYVDRFFVYMTAHDVALTSKGTYNAQSLYALWYPGDDQGKDAWLAEITSLKSSRFLMRGSVSEPTLIYMQPFSAAPGTNVGTIGFFIHPSAIQESVAAIRNLSRGIVMVIDQDDKILFSSRADLQSGRILYSDLKGARGARQDVIDGESALVSHIQSDVTDWKYVYVLPMSVYRTKITYIQRTSLILLTAILIIGGLLITYFVYINYNPILNIISMLRKNIGDRNKYGHNEYTLIQEILSGLMREHDQMTSEIEKKNGILKRLYIAKLLQEGAEDESVAYEVARQHELGFTQGFFAVILFDIEELGNLFQKDTDVYFLIENVFRELAENIPTAFTEIGGHLACLANLTGEPGEKERMNDILEKTFEFIENKFDIVMSIAVSSIHHGYANVPEAYQEAMDAMERMDLSASGGIVDHDQILAKSEPGRGIELFFQDESKLYNLLINHEFKKARVILAVMYDNLSNLKEAPSKDVLRFQMLGLMNTILRALYSLKPQQARLLVGTQNPIKRLSECQRPEDYRPCFDQILDEAEASFVTAERSMPLRDDLTNYIEDHFNNPNLSLTLIADEFIMTESGLSRYFRKKVGIGLLEFIHRTRVQKAKDLLSSPELSIRVIAGRVGLDSSDSLIRVFKKYEGVTPGSYREILQRSMTGKKKR